MTAMCTLSKPKLLNILGVGIIKIAQITSEEPVQIIFQQGIGIPLIQNVFEIFKQEFSENNEGTSIIPLEEFAIFINFFKNHLDEYNLLIYMYDKENSEIYSQLYLHSRKIKNSILSNVPIAEVIEICRETTRIPLVGGIKGVYVLGVSGIPLFSVRKQRDLNADDSQLVGGLISALFNFAQHLIGKDSGGQLKEINFGNQSFYTITKSGVIFVFLVDNMSPLLKRYMYIVADEFLVKYIKYVQDFDGNITPFQSFNRIVDQYFIIEES